MILKCKSCKATLVQAKNKNVKLEMSKKNSFLINITKKVPYTIKQHSEEQIH